MDEIDHEIAALYHTSCERCGAHIWPGDVIAITVEDIYLCNECANE